MSLNPTTWNWKMLVMYIFTAIVVVALGPKLIDFAVAVLGAIKGLIPS